MYLFPSINSETGDASHIIRLLTSNTKESVMADGIVRQKYNKWNPVPKEIQDAVVEYYLAGNSALAASKKFGVCAYKILINRNIPMSSVEQYRNRNQDKINEIVRLYKEEHRTMFLLRWA